MLIPALRRCGLSFLILLLVSVVVFAATEILPGDALEVSLTTDEIAMMSAEQLDAKRAALGLDRPAHVRYAEWLGGMLTGNFGTTLIDRTPVAQRIVDPIRNSILLG
ncbi:MAG: ABC transporter permease, partial [Alphaproteobacteria bacterium]